MATLLSNYHLGRQDICQKILIMHSFSPINKNEEDYGLWWERVRVVYTFYYLGFVGNKHQKDLCLKRNNSTMAALTCHKENANKS